MPSSSGRHRKTVTGQVSAVNHKIGAGDKRCP